MILPLSLKIILAVVALFGAMCFVPMIRRWVWGEAEVEFSIYQLGDAVFAGILGIFFLLAIYGSVGNESTGGEPLTVRGIFEGSILYITIVGGIIALHVWRRIPLDGAFGLHHEPVVFAFLRGWGWGWIAYPVIIGSFLLVSQGAGGTQPQPLLQFFWDHPDTFSRGLVIALAVGIAPLSEEIIFRGYLYPVLRHYGGGWCGLIVSSLLFAAVHLDLTMMPSLFLFGCLLCFIYERYGSIVVPIAMHACFNATSLFVSLLVPGN